MQDKSTVDASAFLKVISAKFPKLQNVRVLDFREVKKGTFEVKYSSTIPEDEMASFMETTAHTDPPPDALTFAKSLDGDGVSPMAADCDVAFKGSESAVNSASDLASQTRTGQGEKKNEKSKTNKIVALAKIEAKIEALREPSSPTWFDQMNPWYSPPGRYDIAQNHEKAFALERLKGKIGSTTGDINLQELDKILKVGNLHVLNQLAPPQTYKWGA